MHTDSSARRTYLASRSASECTTTVLMPSSRQARWMRSAISPRLAMRIFSNMAYARGARRRVHSNDDEQGLAVFDGFAILDQDLLDHARLVGFDLVEQLHRFDDAQGIAFLDRLADFDEGGRAR